MKPERGKAARAAERLLREEGYSELPINVLKLARGEEIEVVAKHAPGASGMLIRVGESYIIAYATHIKNTGYQRFSIAHELGHYFLPGHIDHVLADGDVHTSKAGAISRDRYEQEADEFAAALLMPSTLVKAVIGKLREPGLRAVQALQERCQTSLSASAIRYCELADEQVAMVVSQDNRVAFSKASSEFLAIPGAEYLPKGTRLPTCSLSNRVGGESGWTSEIGVVSMQEWFSRAPDIELVEESCWLGSYGRTLTLLTPEVPYDPDEADAEDAEDESWIPRFRK